MAKTATRTAESAAEDVTAVLSPVARVRANTTPQATKEMVRPAGTLWGAWSVVAQEDHTVEHAKNPRYLWNRADEIRPLDYIEIKHPYGLWCLCLDVVRVDREQQAVIAYIRNEFDFSRAEIIMPDISGATIEFLGASQWTIKDGHRTIKDGFASRQSAEAHLADLRRR